jgi:Flp pilus assembly protein TadG
VAASRINNSVISRTRVGETGQALLEFALIGSVMMVMALGLIDLGRAIFDKEILSDLSRTGSNLASRGPCDTLSLCLSTAGNAVMTEPSALNLTANGLVIITAVQANGAGATSIIGQYSQGNTSLGSSQIGTMGGGTVNLPVTTPPIPPANQTIYVTEVFYAFTPVTPIGKFINIVIPPTLYDVAYF